MDSSLFAYVKPREDGTVWVEFNVREGHYNMHKFEHVFPDFKTFLIFKEAIDSSIGWEYV